MSVSISKTNAKMGGIPSISFPPVVTCAECVGCAKKCYARRMACRRPSIGEAWQGNLNEWRTNPDAVKYAILSAAVVSGYFRYFVGGDIPDKEFFAVMVEIANTAKKCEFLAFTKKFDIVNEFLNGGGILPENLHVIFSEWGAPAPNPHGLPVSRVIFKGDEIPENAKICGGNCVECICRGVACWQMKNGDAIHFFEH